MRDEYKIQRQGKTHVLYPGLLNEVHERYAEFTIDTELIEAGEQPIVKATFEGKYLAEIHYGGKNHEQVRTRRTSGIGTAGRATDRKGPAVDAPIEMAETRAKARALRDAVNVGETAFEELPEEPDYSSKEFIERTNSQQAPNPPSKPSTTAPKPSRGSTPTPPLQGDTETSRANSEAGDYDKEPGSISRSTEGRLNYMLGEYAKRKDIASHEAVRMLLAYLRGEQGMQINNLGDLSEYDGHKWIQRYQNNLAKLEEEESA
jgi:hypothetical protein